MVSKGLALALLCAFVASASAALITEEIEAFHFHTYFFEPNPRLVDEALTLRRKARELINDGSLPECSLNQIAVGWDGPHPVSQYEMCCNKTSFAAASSFWIQNHGNLSVLIHPLTIYDLDDHLDRTSWLGEPVVLDPECGDSHCLYPILPKPRPCPVYPNYSDELPTSEADYQIPLPGTEDYKRRNKNFDILKGEY